ncbi:MAG: twin-arginine translocase TatA/TatE family subunit [Pseudobdellovibrionaceae bacterium]|nr:twin-arginine translocase TatA/TatE family subunit [Bdellovibrionales bacterium]USN46523.1 MAG: twin-arginine translocase TatA/TatE family subunit [Pseudobdellovibrionaceae bacterium]
MSPSIWQILIVLAIILILFGPKRIPGLGKSLGEAIRGFKKGLNEDEIDVTDSARKEELRDGNSDKKTSEKTEKERV